MKTRRKTSMALFCIISLLFFAAPSSFSQSCISPPPQMISWWPGDGSANDIQGSNQGTLQGNVTFAAGMVGQAFSFNGVDSYVNVPDSASLQIKTAFTIDAWVKPLNSITSDQQWIAGKTGRYGIEILADGRANFYLEITFSSDNQVASVHSLQANVFTHVAGTYDPATGLQKIYLNGVLDNSRTTSGTPKGSGGALQIGGEASAVLFYLFSGLIDEVHLFSRALSDSEIFNIYIAHSAGVCKVDNSACGFTLLPENQTFLPGGGTGTFHVVTGTGCNWGVGSNDSFITLTSPNSGSGNGKIDFTVAAYTGAYPRSGSLFLHGNIFNVVQAGSCVYVPGVDPTYFTKAGGTGTLYVSTYSNCAWEAASAASSYSWIRFASPRGGNGNGMVDFTVDPNPGVYRVGQISPDFGLDLFSIVQAGDPCSYRLEATPSLVYPQTGGLGSVNVVAPTTGACGWRAISNDPWIELTAGQFGNGNGKSYFTLHPNSGGFRNGSIDVAGLTQIIQQDGCRYSITPAGEQILGQAAGPGSFTVTTDSNCIWQASSTVDWVTLANNSASSQTGSGTLNFNVAANTSPSQRYGKIFAGDQSVSVLQENANGCYYKTTPNLIVYDSEGSGSATIHVEAPANCQWTASSSDPGFIFGTQSSPLQEMKGTGTSDVGFFWGESCCHGTAGNINVEGSIVTLSPSEGVGSCMLGALTRNLNGPAQAPALSAGILPSARRLRDEVMSATPRGQMYTQLYYHFSAEAIQKALSNPKLLWHATQLLNRYRPVMESLLTNKTAFLNEADLLEMENLIDEFAVGASSEFLTTLVQLKKDLRDPWVHREFNLNIRERSRTR